MPGVRSEVYGPPLNTHCTMLEGPAALRISNATDVMPHGGGGQDPPHHQLIAGRLLDLPMSAYRSELREPVSACSARAAILISAFIRAMISVRAR